MKEKDKVAAIPNGTATMDQVLAAMKPQASPPSSGNFITRGRKYQAREIEIAARVVRPRRIQKDRKPLTNQAAMIVRTQMGR